MNKMMYQLNVSRTSMKWTVSVNSAHLDAKLAKTALASAQSATMFTVMWMTVHVTVLIPSITMNHLVNALSIQTTYALTVLSTMLAIAGTAMDLANSASMFLVIVLYATVMATCQTAGAALAQRELLSKTMPVWNLLNVLMVNSGLLMTHVRLVTLSDVLSVPEFVWLMIAKMKEPVTDVQTVTPSMSPLCNVLSLLSIAITFTVTGVGTLAAFRSPTLLTDWSHLTLTTPPRLTGETGRSLTQSVTRASAVPAGPSWPWPAWNRGTLSSTANSTNFLSNSLSIAARWVFVLVV